MNESCNDEICSSLVQTLRDSDLRSLLQDAGEYGLDAILKNEALQSIPVIATLRNLYKGGVSVRDYLFTKKLIRFLVSLEDTTSAQRKEMIEKLESDPKYNHKVGEQIILLLDRMDDMQKPKFMARVFRAYLENKIDAVELQRMNFGIDHVFTTNLLELKRYYKTMTRDDFAYRDMDPMVFQNLANCGFLVLASGAGGGVGTKKNEMGGKFVDLILYDSDEVLPGKESGDTH
jgi:hypothetical protein